MNLPLIPPLTLISFLLLACSVLSLWVTKKALGWGIFLVIVSGVVLSSNHMTPMGMFALIIYVGLALCIKWIAKPKAKILLQAIFAIASLLLLMHLVPGFNNYLLLNKEIVKPGCVPYSLYINFDKPLIGITILGLMHPLMRQKNAWLLAIKKTFPLFVLGVIALFLFASILQLVRFQPSTPPFFIYWLIANLFFVAFPEEAFARGLILRFLIHLSDRLILQWIANIVVAFLFALLHYYFAENLAYAAVVFLANLFYGWIYLRSGSIEMAILSHFLTNVIHLLLFSYPFLA